MQPYKVNPIVSGWLWCHQFFIPPDDFIAHLQTPQLLRNWHKATVLDVCSHEVFCLSFCKSKRLGQRKQRGQHSKSKMYSLLHRNPTPETSCWGKCRPGLYLLNLDCVSSSGWIGQVHRATVDTFLRGPDPGINGEGTGGGDFFLFSSFSFHSISLSPHE